MYSCELCTKQFVSQLKFFEHLKSHYEPSHSVRETKVTEPQPPHLTPTIQDSFSIKSEFQQVSTSHSCELVELVLKFGAPSRVSSTYGESRINNFKYIEKVTNFVSEQGNFNHNKSLTTMER